MRGFSVGALFFLLVILAGCGGGGDSCPPCDRGVGPIVPPDPPDPPASQTILIAIDRDGSIYELDPETGDATFLLETERSGGIITSVVKGAGPLDYVSSMLYNEETGTLWAGTGRYSDQEACIFSISPNGIATLLADNYQEFYSHPGMAQRRSDHVIFGTEGQNSDDLLLIDDSTGVATMFAESLDTVSKGGMGLTFVGENLYLAAREQLWMINTSNGAPTLVADMTFVGLPTSSGRSRLPSMTTRPSDNQVFAIYRYYEYELTHLCRVNVNTGVVTNIGELPGEIDGLAWVPADYFTPQ
jgi:hypothetical protein